jgi:hypothetical protein
VQCSSQQLLSRPAFSNQQDGRVAERGSIDELHHGAHRARLGKDPGHNFVCNARWHLKPLNIITRTGSRLTLLFPRFVTVFLANPS